MARPRSSSGRGAPSGSREGDQEAERHRQIIGVALLQAERTGPDIQHQLKEPRPRQRRGGNDRDRQRRRQRRIAGRAQTRGICGGIERHGPNSLRFDKRPIPPDRQCRAASHSLPRGLTRANRPLYSARFARLPSGEASEGPCGGTGRRARTQNRVPQGVLVRFRPGAPTRLFKHVPKRPQPSAQCSETLEK